MHDCECEGLFCILRECMTVNVRVTGGGFLVKAMSENPVSWLASKDKSSSSFGSEKTCISFLPVLYYMSAQSQYFQLISFFLSMDIQNYEQYVCTLHCTAVFGLHLFSKKKIFVCNSF